MADNTISIDDLTPAEVATKSVGVGVKKAGLDSGRCLFWHSLAVLYIAIGLFRQPPLEPTALSFHTA